jgi:hypothetical protein
VSRTGHVVDRYRFVRRVLESGTPCDPRTEPSATAAADLGHLGAVLSAGRDISAGLGLDPFQGNNRGAAVGIHRALYGHSLDRLVLAHGLGPEAAQ